MNMGKDSGFVYKQQVFFPFVFNSHRKFSLSDTAILVCWMTITHAPSMTLTLFIHMINMETKHNLHLLNKYPK